MSTSITAYTAYPLGSWLAAMAIGLVLLALACAQAPDLASQSGLRSPSACPLTNKRPVPERQRGYHLAPSQARVLASVSSRQPARMASHTSLSR